MHANFSFRLVGPKKSNLTNELFNILLFGGIAMGMHVL